MQKTALNYVVDGDKIMATEHDFINLQESPAGFGDTISEAFIDFCRNGRVPEMAECATWELVTRATAIARMNQPVKLELVTSEFAIDDTVYRVVHREDFSGDVLVTYTIDPELAFGSTVMSCTVPFAIMQAVVRAELERRVTLETQR